MRITGLGNENMEQAEDIATEAQSPAERTVATTGYKEAVLCNENHQQSEESTRNVSDESFQRNLRELLELTPQVAKSMENMGFLRTWILFHKLISQNRFPSDNMSFRLFMDVVRFFGCSSTTNMTYSENVKLFWETGGRLFHSKFMNFMGGPKNHGQIVDGTADKGFLNPLVSKINFAVPKM